MAKKKSEFTKTQIDEIKQQAIRFWDTADNAQGELFELINELERIYRAQLPTDLEAAYKEHPDRASLAPPDAYINVRSIRAGLRHLIFGRKPYGVIAKPGEPGVRNELVKKAELVLQAGLDMQSDTKGFEHEADKCIHQAIYAGITAAYDTWHVKREREVVQDEAGRPMLDKNGKIVFRSVVMAEYPETIGTDIRRLRIDPSAESREQIRMWGIHGMKNLSDLIALNRDPNSKYNFSEKELSRSAFPSGKYYQYKKGEHNLNENQTNEDFGDQVVEHMDIRGLFRFEKKDGSFEFKDLIVRIGNREHVLAVWENDGPIPTWRLLHLPSIDTELGNIYTMGVLEPMMDTWLEMFMKLNQSLDEASRSTYDMFIADKAAAQELPSIIERTPDRILKIDTMASGIDDVNKAFAPLRRNPSTQDTFKHSAVLGDKFQQGTGLNDFMQGLDPSRQETATAVVELVAGGRALLAQFAKNLKDTFFVPSWKNHLIMWNFYKGAEKRRVFDQSGSDYIVMPGELKGFWQVDIDISVALDRPDMARRFIEMFPIIKDDPLFDLYEVRKIAIEMLQLPGSDRILKPNDYVEMIVQRENAALIYGADLPVHPADPHSKHIEGVDELITYLQTEPAQIEIDTRLALQAAQNHRQAHVDEMERQQTALGNTKDLGGNAGQLRQPAAGAIKPRGQGATGNYTPSAGRR